ncbi:hypothetical protein PS1_018961 [Malus domestica]
MGKPRRSTRPSSTALRRPFQTKRANGQTSSPVFYGHIVPPKDEQPNENEMATNLALEEEKREKVITRIAAYQQQQLLSSYNKRAKIQQP